MVKDLQLRQEADRLIQEAGRPGPARQEVEGACRVSCCCEAFGGRAGVKTLYLAS